MLVALPAGGRGGDKLDAGAAAPEARLLLLLKLEPPRLCPPLARGVTAAPPTRLPLAILLPPRSHWRPGGGDHSCRKGRRRGQNKGRREKHLGHRGQLPKSMRWGRVVLPLSSFPPAVRALCLRVSV